MAATVPAPRVPDRYVVGFVCSGNICRSPTADVILAQLAADADLPVTAISSGLGDWHVGGPMDDRSAEVLRRAGYHPDDHRAQEFDRSWYDDVDLILAMDGGHLEVLERRAPAAARERVRLFGEFDPSTPGADVPDPYYGGVQGFEEVLAMIERTCTAMLPLIESALQQKADPGAL